MEQLEVRGSFGGVRTALLVLIMGVSAEVRLGGLFQHTATKVGRFVAFLMAVEEINNSTDLLPGDRRVEPDHLASQRDRSSGARGLLLANQLHG